MWTLPPVGLDIKQNELPDQITGAEAKSRFVNGELPRRSP
jgi:hypothetical protein